ncbi:DnaB-like helicase C-terminal domain-containing protein [Priestia megaterium]|uniref:DnaB-like helicase C-terminal domain-containing protein n=1 Tax=Priestia megaterium TaxID=1404 RepID=UPI00211C0FC8|nr:DnaB-like helicase C-terminal domain-containing protein [Priestia megaterium]
MSNAPELHSESVERYIIKVMYNRPESIIELAQSLRPNDFFTPAYRYLFTAIKMLSLKGDITAEGIMTLLEAENRDGYHTLTGIGGAPVIENFFRDHSLPKAPAVDVQISIMKTFAYRRNAVEVSEKIRRAAESNVDIDSNKQFEDVEDLDARIKELTYSLADNINVADDVEKIGKKVSAVKDSIKNKDFSGIDIGFLYPKLNNVIKKLRNKALYVFGAPEKVGKSTFMTDIGWNIAEKLGIPVAYADTEMTEEEQLLRICSKISGVPEDKISEDDLTPEQRVAVDAAWDHIEKVPFYHFNANELTNAELESKVKLLQLRHGIGLFIYDYVKIQSHEAEKGRLDMIMASKIDTLKEKIAKQCDIPVITSGQMYPLDDTEQGQKAGKNKHKFAETSHFTKLADVIARLDRCNPEDPTAFGTHYVELIMGRKVSARDVGKRVQFDFKQEIHKIRELV